MSTKYNKKIKTYKQEDKNYIEGERKMAVSKAVLTCVKGKGAKELIEDMKSTSLNTEVISDCQQLIKKLIKAKKISK